MGLIRIQNVPFSILHLSRKKGGLKWSLKYMERNKRILFSGTIAVISRNLVLLSIGRIFCEGLSIEIKVMQ